MKIIVLVAANSDRQPPKKYVYNNEVNDISKSAHDYAINKFSFKKLGALYNNYYLCQ